VKLVVLNLRQNLEDAVKLNRETIEGMSGELAKIHAAHNAVNFEKLKWQYKVAEANGVSPENLDEAFVNFYHAYPIGRNIDFSNGLDKTKSTGGFYFTKSVEESKEALVSMGYNLQDLEVVRIKIPKNIYYSSPGRPIIEVAPTWESDAFYVPLNNYDKFNKLMNDKWIVIEQ